MKQKFRKFSFVHVGAEMPDHMSHFESDFDAIIEGTYSQLFGGTDIDNYSLYRLRDGRIVYTLSWYEENQLVLLPEQDSEKAEEMVEKYNLREG